MKKLFPLLFLLLLVGAFASAEIDVVLYNVADDFTVAVDGSSIDFCSCTTQTEKVIVRNIGSFSSLYSITAEANSVSLSENTFELMPGEAKTIFLTISSTCGKEKDFKIPIRVTSNTGKVKEIVRPVHITTCQNIIFSANTNVESVLPCTPITYELVLENNGPFTEDYSFSTNPKIDVPDVTLAPNTSTSFNVTQTFTCDVRGEQTFTFDAYAKKNRLRATVVDTVTIEDKYDLSVDFAAPFVACEGVENVFPITLTNNNHFVDDYSLSLRQETSSRTSFYLSHDRFHLEAGESAVVNVHVAPTDPRDRGQDKFVLEVQSDIEGVKHVMPFTSDIRHCYQTSTEILKEAVTECSGLYVYEVVVSNLGSFEELITLSLAAPEFMELEKYNITLPAGQEETVMLYVDTTEQPATATYNASVTASLAVGMTSNDQFLFTHRPESVCRQVVVEPSTITIDYETTEKELRIRNNPYREGTYAVSFNGPNWMTVNTSFVQLSPEELLAIPILFTPFNITEGTYDVTITLLSVDDPSLSYASTISISLHDKPFLVKLGRFLLLNPCFILTLLLGAAFIILFVLFLAMPKIRLTKKYKRENGFWFSLFYAVSFIFLVVAILLAIFVVQVPVNYPDMPASNDSLHISWYENHELSIDLGAYFFSPEFSSLSYEATQPDEFTINIDGSTATITPQRNWHGVRTAVFTAVDVVDASTTSTEFTLEIVDVPKPNIYVYLGAFCQWINLVLFMAIVLVAYSVWLHAKREEKKPARRKRK